MNCFEILGIEPDAGIREIRKAYAAKSRECHPEEKPEEFKRLHDAYQEALARARNPQGAAFPEEEAPLPEETEVEEEPVSREKEEPLPPEEIYQEETPAEETLFSGEWEESFSRIAGASMDNVGLAQAVRQVLEHCRALYRQERERGKLYRWKDIFEEPRFFPVFATREFVEGWYGFLRSHHTFPLQLWQYFASLDGFRFSGEAAGLGRFPYGEYMEEARTETQAGAGNGPQASGGYGPWKEANPAREQAPPPRKEKKPRPLWLKVLFYLVLAAGSALLGTVTGLAVGLLV